MNSAVTRTINANELANTATIQKRSRRALQWDLRFSAGASATATDCRRRASNSTINAASATMVTKKKKSLRTIRPTLAISRFYLAFEFLPRPHHEYDHGHDEEGRGQHHPTFDEVLVKLKAGKENRYADAGNEGRAQRHEHGLAEVRPLNLVQIGKRDADNEG